MLIQSPGFSWKIRHVLLYFLGGGGDDFFCMCEKVMGIIPQKNLMIVNPIYLKLKFSLDVCSFRNV